jgi:hypothetical protein
MTQPNDLEPRVTKLEIQVRDLNEQVQLSVHDAAAARVLAGRADRSATEVRGDLRDFRRAVTSNFNAMREDLNDFRRDVDERFDRIDGKFGEVDGKFEMVDRGFAEVRGRLDAAAAGQQLIVDMLNVLIAREGEVGQG